MKKWKRNLIGMLVVAYVIHVIIVVSWHIFPIVRAVHDDKVYTVRHGFGIGPDLVPLVGLIPAFSGETVNLTIEDTSTGKKQYLQYDLAMDVYDDYPDVFHDK